MTRKCTTCGLPATEFPCGHPCRQDAGENATIPHKLMAKLSAALGHPRMLFGTSVDEGLVLLAIQRLRPVQIYGKPQARAPIHHYSDEERAYAIEQAQDNPMTAGEIEYASWIEHMELRRGLWCPDGNPHDHEPLDHVATGYFYRCLRCGHHDDKPF